VGDIDRHGLLSALAALTMMCTTFEGTVKCRRLGTGLLGPKDAKAFLVDPVGTIERENSGQRDAADTFKTVADDFFETTRRYLSPRSSAFVLRRFGGPIGG
jgi:hypothetical protein